MSIMAGAALSSNTLTSSTLQTIHSGAAFINAILPTSQQTTTLDALNARIGPAYTLELNSISAGDTNANAATAINATNATTATNATYATNATNAMYATNATYATYANNAANTTKSADYSAWGKN